MFVLKFKENSTIFQTTLSHRLNLTGFHKFLCDQAGWDVNQSHSNYHAQISNFLEVEWNNEMSYVAR